MLFLMNFYIINQKKINPLCELPACESLLDLDLVDLPRKSDLRKKKIKNKKKVLALFHSHLYKYKTKMDTFAGENKIIKDHHVCCTGSDPEKIADPIYKARENLSVI